MLPIRNSMESPKQFRFMFNSVCGMIAGIYLIYSICAVYAYGSKLQDIILLNFGKENPIVYVLSFFYAIGIFITFPYVLFPLAPSLLSNFTHDDQNQVTIEMQFWV